jgi:hypothetical protein
VATDRTLTLGAAGNAIAGVLLTRLRTTSLFLCSAAASLAAMVWVLVGVADHPARAITTSVVRRAQAGQSRAAWFPADPAGLPGGLGSEWARGRVRVVFVPLAGPHAGYLFSATAAGMLIGDVIVGRFVPQRIRDRLVGPLRFLLATPYLLFLTRPPIAVGAVLGFVASIGYAASLPLLGAVGNEYRT